MSNDTVVSLAAPARVSDPLTELLRTGARRLIEAAVTAEFEEYLSGFVQEKLPDGRQRVVRNGHLHSHRAGEVDVRVPKGAVMFQYRDRLIDCNLLIRKANDARNGG